MRTAIEYKKYNLLDSFTSFGKFDLIFCRNVLIYFDLETKRDILKRVSAQMNEKSFLLLGAAETVVGVVDCFAPNKSARGLYEKSNGQTAGTTRPGIRAA